MSFAGTDQIYIPGPITISCRGSVMSMRAVSISRRAKRQTWTEHPVYELVDAVLPVAEVALPQTGEPAPAIKLEPFSFKCRRIGTAKNC